MEKITVLGIIMANRSENAAQVQKLLTEYGCNIKTRIGLHEVNEKLCSTSGLILLELFGDEVTCAELEKKLKALKGIQIQKMLFKI